MEPFNDHAESTPTQFRQRRKQVSDQTVVGNLEDGSIFVLVDGHNDLTVLHAGQMLNRSGDTHSNVQIRATILPSVMHVVWHEACVHAARMRQ